MRNSPARNRGARPAAWPPSGSRTHAVSVRFTAPRKPGAEAPRRPRAICAVAGSSASTSPRCRIAVPGAAPAPPASAEAVARRVELRRVGRLPNDATRALHAARGHPDAQTLVALRQAAEAVARQLGRWP